MKILACLGDDCVEGGKQRVEKLVGVKLIALWAHRGRIERYAGIERDHDSNDQRAKCRTAQKHEYLFGKKWHKLSALPSSLEVMLVVNIAPDGQCVAWRDVSYLGRYSRGIRISNRLFDGDLVREWDKCTSQMRIRGHALGGNYCWHDKRRGAATIITPMAVPPQ